MVLVMCPPHAHTCTTGNLYGLRERVVAASSLMALAEELQRAKGPLLALLGPSDSNAVEQFFQVVFPKSCVCCVLVWCVLVVVAMLPTGCYIDTCTALIDWLHPSVTTENGAHCRRRARQRAACWCSSHPPTGLAARRCLRLQLPPPRGACEAQRTSSWMVWFVKRIGATPAPHAYTLLL